MRSGQPSFTDVEFGNRRRVSRRPEFLDTMDAMVPWAKWVAVIEPFYYDSRRDVSLPKRLETMLRMYLLQVWFSLSDEGDEDEHRWCPRSRDVPDGRRRATSGTSV